ncbi:MAG: hypothetical protein ABIS01_16130 [Ferruginibacter sp.]
MIFAAPVAFSQSLVAKQHKMLLLQPVNSPGSSLILFSKPTNPVSSVKPVIAPDFYVTQLGFFCKQEIKFEKATKIPFRFRLGSIEDCDRMEGKHRQAGN